MPLLDLPLDELKKYGGRNPRPSDFDDYWSDALSEMHALGTTHTLTKVAFPSQVADFFELRFTGVGGADVFAKLAVPKNLTGSAPAVLRFHGYSMDSEDWSGLISLAAEGFVVAFLDVRGQAGRSTDKGWYPGWNLNGHIVRGLEGDPKGLYFRNVFLDTAHLARIVASLPEVDANRLAATGWSQGGALTLVCAALEPSIKRIAPVYPFLCDYQRVWEMDLAKGAYDELRAWFRRFDRLHSSETEVFTKLGYIDVQHLAPRIQAQTLMVTGLMDDICPPSTQFAAYNKITAPKEMMIFPDFGHEGLPQAPDRIHQFLLEL